MEKQALIDERTAKLSEPSVHLDNVSSISGLEEWQYRPIRLRGIFDHEKETMIQRTVKGERGYEVVTPLYTGLDEKTGALQGVMVNRGRIPFEYKDSRMHWTEAGKECDVEGVLFKSEGSGTEKNNLDGDKKR